MKGCDRCRGRAVIQVKYSGAHLCRNHFNESVEKRARHELKSQMRLERGARIAVAVSGGKDSTATQFLMHRILGKRRDLEIAAITVDEGIEGYRESSIPIVARNSRLLDMEHIVVSLKDLYGVTVDEIANADRNLAVCSYCGVLRRAALNRTARRWGATHLATGLNLDDTCQSILMNFARGDIERMARLGPHTKVQPGLVPRIQPLRLIPESESLLYAIANHLEFHDLECPYASEALRNQYREVVAQLEDRSPGTRQSLVASFDGLRPALEKMFPPSRLARCACGEPTIGTKCKACELVEGLGPKAIRPSAD